MQSLMLLHDEHTRPYHLTWKSVCCCQVLVIGKLSQAVVVAAAAYRDQSGFQQLTGIDQTHMVEDSGSWDTQVSLLPSDTFRYALDPACNSGLTLIINMLLALISISDKPCMTGPGN